MGYKNQRYVMIKIEGVEKAKESERPFLGIYKDTWYNAVKDLEPHAFVLYLYLASNKYDFNLELSQVAVENATGLAKSTYYKSFNKLVEKGYLIETSPHHYNFYDKPHNVVFLKDNDFSQEELPSPPKRQDGTQGKGEINNINKINNSGINKGNNIPIVNAGNIIPVSDQEKENLRKLCEALDIPLAQK